MLAKAVVCYLPLEGKISVLLFKNCQCQQHSFYSPFENHVMDFLISSHKKRDCSFSGSLLELYCQEPSWPLALSTENAALERIEHSLGGGGGDTKTGGERQNLALQRNG